MTRHAIAVALATALFATTVARAQFTYRPPGDLVAGSGRGRVDFHVYAPGIRFPIERAPAYPNSQVYGNGGSHGGGGDQCDADNYSYPWHDNYCETRSWDMPMCPAGVGHQGQDMRPSTCVDNTHWAVAAVDGEITHIGSYSVYLTGDGGQRYDYLHMRSVAVSVGEHVTRGQHVGRVSNNFGGTRTTIHLHFNIYRNVSGFGSVYAPTYMSLVRSYEALLGDSAPPCAGSPTATEVCNGTDDDCNGDVDENGVCESAFVLAEAGRRDWTATSDVDGDGRADACVRGGGGVRCVLGRAEGPSAGTEIEGPPLYGDAWAAPELWTTVRMGDVTGDGLSDVCARDGERFRCWASKGTAFDLDAPIDGPMLADADGWNDASQFTTIRLADFDGDGRADLCARHPGGMRCYPSTGTGFGAPTAPIDDLANGTGWSGVIHYGTLAMGDVDGDGRADVCGRAIAGMACWISDGAGFPDRIAGPGWSNAAGWDALDRWATIQLADVDGDGRADLCARGADGFRCHLSEGRSFGARIDGPALTDTAGWNEAIRYATIRMADVNGDGALDVCARNDTSFGCWPWTGSGFGRRIAGPAMPATEDWELPSHYRTIRVADVSGDGRADVCAIDAMGLACWLATDTRGFGERVAAADWTGLGGLTRYASLRIALGPRAAPPDDPSTPMGSTDGGASMMDPPPRGGPAIAEASASCGCRAAGSGASRPLGVLVLVAAAVWTASRRKRRSGHGHDRQEPR